MARRLSMLSLISCPLPVISHWVGQVKAREHRLISYALMDLDGIDVEHGALGIARRLLRVLAAISAGRLR
jgi:hypothetical protein